MSGKQQQQQQPQRSRLKEAHVVRVFFSSPFGGMEGEREELTRLYLPRLHSLCQARGLRFVAVDLRWGITTEAADSAQTLTICLRELDRADVFVGFYGQRYGWHCLDGSDQVLARNFELAAGRYPWVRQYADRSVTELEFLHGHLNQPGSLPAIICFRDKAYDDKMREQGAKAGDQKQVFKYTAESEHATLKLQDLKARVEQTKDKCLAVSMNYETPEEAAKTIFEALWQHLNSVLLKEDQETQSPLQRMRAEHDAFLRTRTSLYFADTSYFRQLDQFHAEGVISGAGTKEESGQKSASKEEQSATAAAGGNAGGPPPRAVVVASRRGLGKSALLCNWIEHRRLMKTDDVIIYHFVGTPQGSTDPTKMMDRLLQELQDALGTQTADGEGNSEKGKDKEGKDSLEETDKWKQKKSRELPEILGLLKLELEILEGRGRKVILVIDGVENLFKGHKTRKVLYWLPEGLTSCVTLVVSCLDSDTALMEELVNVRRFHTLTVQPLARHTQQQLCVATLKEAGKELSPQQLERVVEAPQTQSPFFLTVMLHELSVFGYFRKLDEKIDSLLRNTKVYELLQHCYLARLEEEYNVKGYENIVQKVLSALVLARVGLGEEELMEMFNIPNHVWLPLFYALERYIMCFRGQDGKIVYTKFLFVELQAAAFFRYLKDDPAFKENIAREMISYFEKDKRAFKPWEGPEQETCGRAMEELPWLYKSLQDKEGVTRTLTHLGIFSRMYLMRHYDLLELWRWAGLGWGKIAELYLQAFDQAVVESYLHHEHLPQSAWHSTPAFPMRDFLVLIIRIVEVGGGNMAAIEKCIKRLIDVCEGAEGKAEERERRRALRGAKEQLASLYSSNERLAEAEVLNAQVLEEAKREYEANPKDRQAKQIYACSCNSTGLLHFYKKKYEKANEFLDIALELHTELGNKEEIAQCLTNKGYVALDQYQLKDAEQYLEKAIQGYSEFHFGQMHHEMGNAMTNLGVVYRRMNRLDDAERIYKKALETKKNAVGEYNPLVATCWMNLGTVASHKHEYKKMEEYTRKALYIVELNDFPEDNKLRWMCTENLILGLIKQDKYEEALPIFRKLHAVMLSRDKIDECLPLVHTSFVTYFLDRGMHEDAERVLVPLLRSKQRSVQNFLQLTRLDSERPDPPTRPHELTLDYALDFYRYPDNKALQKEYTERHFISKDDLSGLLAFLESRLPSGQHASLLASAAQWCGQSQPPRHEMALAVIRYGLDRFPDNQELEEAMLEKYIELGRHKEALEYAERVQQRQQQQQQKQQQEEEAGSSSSSSSSSDPPFSAGLLLKAATVALHCQQRPLALSLCDAIFAQLGDNDSTSEKAVELLKEFGVEPRNASQKTS